MIFILACQSDVFDTVEQSEENIASSEEFAMAIEEASRALLSIDPLLHHDAWDSSMERLSDDSCPPMELHNGMDLWRDTCETEEGHQFLGWTLHFDIRNASFPEGDLIFTTHHWLSGQAQIVSADGIILQNFGDLLLRTGYSLDGRSVVDGFIYGDFSWSDPTAHHSWLSTESSLSTEYYYSFIGEGAELTAQIQAWLTGFSESIPAAIFDEIELDAQSCMLEPLQGEIWLRDQGGLWHDIRFDGSDACDGCGWNQDQKICADFSPWFGWTEQPWRQE